MSVIPFIGTEEDKRLLWLSNWLVNNYDGSDTLKRILGSDGSNIMQINRNQLNDVLGACESAIHWGERGKFNITLTQIERCTELKNLIENNIDRWDFEYGVSGMRITRDFIGDTDTAHRHVTSIFNGVYDVLYKTEHFNWCFCNDDMRKIISYCEGDLVTYDCHKGMGNYQLEKARIQDWAKEYL